MALNFKTEYCAVCDAPIVNGVCKRCNLKKETMITNPLSLQCKHCNGMGKLLLTFTNPNGYLCEPCHCRYVATQNPIFNKIYENSERTIREAKECGMSNKDYCLMLLKKNPWGQMFLNTVGEK